MKLLDRGIATLYKMLTWGVHYTSGHVYRICTSFCFFKAEAQTNWRTRLKICELIAFLGGWARAIVVAGAGRPKKHVPEEESFISVDPPSL